MPLDVFSPASGDVLTTSVWPNSGPPTGGSSGTLAGIAQRGDLLSDSANGVLYQNVGTQASPTWAPLALTGVAIGLAAVGTTRATALALTARRNVVATAASAATGVTLPPSLSIGIGNSVYVYNDGPSNAFHVYASGSDTIDGTAGSTGVDLTNAFFCQYLLGSAGAFLSYRSAIVRSA